MVQLDRKERVKALLDNVGRSLKERDLPVSAAYVIQEVSKRLLEAEDKCGVSREELNQYIARTAQLENQVKESESSIARDKKQLADYANQTAKYEQLLNEYAERLQGYENRLAEYSVQAARYEDTLARDSEQRSKYEARIQEYTEQASQYESRLAECTRQISEEKARVAEYADKSGRYERLVAEYNAKINSYTEKIAESEKLLAAARDSLSSCEERIAEYEKTIESNRQKFTEQAQELSKHHERSIADAAAISDRDWQLRLYGDYAEDCEERIVEGEEALALSSAKLCEQELIIEQCRQTIKASEELIAKQKADAMARSAVIIGLNRELDEARFQKKNAEDTISQLENALGESNKQRDEGLGLIADREAQVRI